MQKIILPAFAILFFSPLTQFAQTGLQTATQAKGSLVGSGQKFIVETTLKTNTAAEVMGQTMETNIDVKTSTNYDVKNAGSESADLQKTVSKLVVSASMMGQELQYDSDKQDNPAQMEEIFSGMVNKPLNLSIDGKGNITKQEEMLQATNPLMMAAGAGAATTTELFVPDLTGKEFVAGDSIKSFLVNTGEKNSSKDSGTYKITIVENGVASISYSGIQQTTGVIEQMGMEMNTTGNNIVKSELQVDIKTGLVLAKATVTEMNTIVEVMGMEIPTTGRSFSTTTVKAL